MNDGATSNSYLYFEDELANVSEVHSRCLPLRSSLDFVTALEVEPAHFVPPPPGTVPRKVPIGRVFETSSLDAHLAVLLRRYPVVILDLELKGTSCQCPYCKEGFHGMHVMAVAKELGCLHKLFVSSANVGRLEPLYIASWELFQQCRDDVTVFDKTRPGDLEQLKRKLEAWMLFEDFDYVADFKTRSDLYLAGTRGQRAKPEHVLITGKSGTGKDRAAQLIHRIGGAEHFVTVPCGALVDRSLAKSDLFGHVKGAYTDAVSHRGGRLLSAIGWKAPVDRHAKNAGESDTTRAKAKIVKAIKQLEADLEAFEASLSSVDAEHVVTKVRVEILKNAIRAGSKALQVYIRDDFRSVVALLRAYADTSLNLKQDANADYSRWLLEGGHLEEADAGDLRVKVYAPTGTIFLDEFQDLPSDVQALLMRLMEQGEMEPLGFNGKILLKDKEGNLHIRMVGASNDDDVAAIARTGRGTGEKVRTDLVFRLACWHVELPPLSADEVEVLIKKEMVEKGMKSEWQIEAIEKLKEAVEPKLKGVEKVRDRFPGHRRQIRQVILRAAAYAEFEQTAGVPTPSPGGRVTPAHVERALASIALRPATDLSDAPAHRFETTYSANGPTTDLTAAAPALVLTYGELEAAVVRKIKELTATQQDGVVTAPVKDEDRSWLTVPAYTHLKVELKTSLSDELKKWGQPDADIREFMQKCAERIAIRLSLDGTVYFPKGHLSNTGKKQRDILDCLMEAADANGWVGGTGPDGTGPR